MIMLLNLTKEITLEIFVYLFLKKNKPHAHHEDKLTQNVIQAISSDLRPGQGWGQTFKIG